MEYGKQSELAGRIIEGKAAIARLDKAEEQGRIAGGYRNVEATLVLGAAFGHHPGEQIGARYAINEEAARKEAVPNN